MNRECGGSGCLSETVVWHGSDIYVLIVVPALCRRKRFTAAPFRRRGKTQGARRSARSEGGDMRVCGFLRRLNGGARNRFRRQSAGTTGFAPKKTTPASMLRLAAK